MKNGEKKRKEKRKKEDLSCFGCVFTAFSQQAGKIQPKQDKSLSFIFRRF